MSVKLTVNGLEYPLNTEKTLLENLEAQAIKMEFHCRTGHCGACRCQLISGQVNYRVSPLAYCRQNEVLTCCSISKKDIHITI
ncbi:class I ribonucleotide reductase maintenance protein YfaE [Psychromonas antarctica]|jgi:ferredoxin|uniref:class I ribonucleotide reductase maintenance protein YfaE n=1 Tax=Psychromonas antarctica TaxID=67573 RepID=UPI001EE9775C|nr:class I ribonucleotide reductase maintenance protein YfaE [Psychromonas antarctica]MCG6200328.1 class I ribonucleotide reductase maintenance protein YfaE [Psychromonas antarctica]